MSEKPRTRSGATGGSPAKITADKDPAQLHDAPPALEQELGAGGGVLKGSAGPAEDSAADSSGGAEAYGVDAGEVGDYSAGEVGEEDLGLDDDEHDHPGGIGLVAEEEDDALDTAESPLFSSRCLGFSEVEKILLGEERVPKAKICQQVPSGEREKKRPASTYIIDLAAIGDFKNILNDTLSPWYAGYGASATSGSLTRHFTLNAEGKATRVDKGHKLPKGQKSDLRIARTLYTNKTAKSLGGRLVRYIYRCLARNGQLRRFVAVCYEWKGPILDFDHLLIGRDMTQQVVYPIERNEQPALVTTEAGQVVGAVVGPDGLAPDGTSQGEGNDIFLSHDDLIASRVEVEESLVGEEEEEEEEDPNEPTDPDTPIYARKSINFDEVEKILLGAERVPKNLICHKTPSGERERVKRSGSYIVDLASMENPNDILNDSLGAWQSGTGGERASYGTNSSGSRMRYYLLRPDGGALRVDKHGRKPPKEIKFDLKINRCLYTNRSAREVGGRLVRRIFRCFTRNGETRRFAVVTYEWISKVVPFELLPPLKRGRKPGISPRRKSDLYQAGGSKSSGKERLDESLSGMEVEEVGEEGGQWGMDVVHEDDIEVGASTTISPGPGGSLGGVRGPGLGRAPVAASAAVPAAQTVLPRQGKKRPLPGIHTQPSEEESKHAMEMKVLVLQEKYLQYKIYKATMEIRTMNPDFDPEAFEETLVQDPRAALAAAQSRLANPLPHQAPAPQRFVVVDAAEGGPPTSSGGQFIMTTAGNPRNGTFAFVQ